MKPPDHAIPSGTVHGMSMTLRALSTGPIAHASEDWPNADKTHARLGQSSDKQAPGSMKRLGTSTVWPAGLYMLPHGTPGHTQAMARAPNPGLRSSTPTVVLRVGKLLKLSSPGEADLPGDPLQP